MDLSQSDRAHPVYCFHGDLFPLGGGGGGGVAYHHVPTKHLPLIRRSLVFAVVEIKNA